LHPLAVIPHLLLSMLVLGGAILVALEALSPPGFAASEELRRAGLVLVGAAFALVVTGTFATAAGPHSGGDKVARFGPPDALRIAERPELLNPVLVTAFRGWNDGGQGASLAAGYLAKTWGASRFADIDPEEFYDFQVSRPHVSLVEGVTRKLEWPENAFYHAH